MENQTNKVREIAKSFLNREIIGTKFPTVASHPFTNSWIAVFPDANGEIHLKMENLADLHKKENASRWKTYMEEKIMESNLVEILSMMNPPYVLEFLKSAFPYVNSEELGMALRAVWQSVEQISVDKSFTEKEAAEWFKKADKSQLMDTEEMEIYNSLPDTVTIYRGVTNFNKKNKKALSWSLDREVAVWFANRFETGTGRVWTMRVPKERILCYFDGREEKEVIVDLQGCWAKRKTEKSI